MSEKEGCLVSRRDDRVSHPILTGRRVLKKNIFQKVARVDHSCEIPGSLFATMLEVILDNNKV